MLVILNEQTRNSDSKNTEGTVNAILAWVFGVGGMVTGELIISSAHSDAHKP